MGPRLSHWIHLLETRRKADFMGRQKLILMHLHHMQEQSRFVGFQAITVISSYEMQEENAEIKEHE